MKQIIAFIGRAGSGKDYQSNLLVEKGFTRLAFADVLRHITADICRISYKDMMDIYEDFKEGEYFPHYTGRQLLENIGKAIRVYDDQFWVKGVLNKIQSENIEKVCISDMRYINEYFALKEFADKNGYDFKCIFCDFHSSRYQQYNNHESAQLSNYLCDNGFKDLQEIKYEDVKRVKEDLCQK